MDGHSQKIKFFRSQIPMFDCVPGCHDCCGPVRTSTEEISRLPVKSASEHDAALVAWSCPYLGDKGCEVYAERPLICRLFGTTPKLICPNGRRPVEMISSEVEEKIFKYFTEVRHVLL
jgi:hypothetical protein